MSKPESKFRQDFDFLVERLDPRPVENLVGKGTPDVNIITGWVELKRAECWPVRLTTPLRLDHYTQEQKDWLLQRWNAGGGAWLCLKIRREWFVWEAPAAQAVGTLCRADLIATATHYFATAPTSDQLCACFRRAT